MNDEANNQRGKKKKTQRGEYVISGAKSQWKKLSMTKSENM